MSNKKVGIGIGVTLLIVILLLVILIFGLKDKAVYKVTFDLGNNNVNEVIEVKEDGIVSKPTDPTKDGYVFEGWYYNDEKFDFSTKITEDITLEARWTSESAKTWTVSFNTNGGNKIDALTVEDGKTLTNLPNPTKNGYTFEGWYYNGLEFDITTVITKNITLDAKWEQEKKTVSGSTTPATVKYSVSFNSDGGTTVKTQTVVKGGLATEPTDPVKAGYTFVGWYNGNVLYDFSTKVTQNITLTAKYTKDVVVSYIIEDVPNSLVNQAKLYILKDGVKVQGTIDVTNESNRTITKTVEATGLDIVKGIYTYSNPKAAN